MIQAALLLGIVSLAPVQDSVWKPGSKAPTFMVKALDGNRLTLPELNPGNTVFLYFIHEEDAVNTAESGYIMKIVNSYMPATTKWYGVTDSEEGHARAWLARYKASYKLLLDRDLQMVHKFKIESSPTVIEIDGQGLIVHEWAGLSGQAMKDLNRAMAAANQTAPKKLDFSAAPSNTEFGVRYGASGIGN